MGESRQTRVVNIGHVDAVDALGDGLGVEVPAFELVRVDVSRKGRRVTGYDLGLGVAVPLSVTGTVRAPGWRFTVTVAVVNRPDGADVVALTLSADDDVSLSTIDLRAVAVDPLVRYVQLAGLVVAGDSSGPWWTADAAALAGADRLPHVATAYRLARVLRANTVEHVAGHLKVSRATAGRLVRQARDAGLIGDDGGEG